MSTNLIGSTQRVLEKKYLNIRSRLAFLICIKTTTHLLDVEHQTSYIKLKYWAQFQIFEMPSYFFDFRVLNNLFFVTFKCYFGITQISWLMCVKANSDTTSRVWDAQNTGGNVTGAPSAAFMLYVTCTTVSILVTMFAAMGSSQNVVSTQTSKLRLMLLIVYGLYVSCDAHNTQREPRFLASQ